MKKNLFYLFALICSMSLFTACSDDEDTTWKQIPSVEISGENATLKVNGQDVAGSVQLQVQNATQGVLKMNNLINGYDKIEMDVTLEKLQDESYNFAGEKILGVTTTKAADTPVTTTVKVTGNITLDGKVNVNASTEFAGGITGNWLLVDSITMDEESAMDNSPLYFKWIAPGHYISSGSTELSSTMIASLVQLIAVPLLSDVLNQVNFGADGNITAKYYSETAVTMDWIMGHMGAIIPSTGKDWKDSPSGLVTWYVKDGKLYVVPNIGNIIAQVMKDGGGDGQGSLDLSGLLNSLSSMSGAQIKAMLSGLLSNVLPENLPLDISKISDADIEKVVGWLTTGIPVNYKTKAITLEDGKTLTGLYVYLDKEFFDIFMPALLPLLPALDSIVQQSAPDIYMLLPYMLGINSLAEIEGIWNDTETFEIGIELADKSFK